MLTILFLLIWRTVATIHGYVKAYAPSNIAIAYLSTRRGQRLAVPVALVVVPVYLYVALLTTALVDRGATDWLYATVLVAYMDACKFAALAVVASMRCVIAAVTGLEGERRARRGSRTGVAGAHGNRHRPSVRIPSRLAEHSASHGTHAVSNHSSAARVTYPTRHAQPLVFEHQLTHP